MKSFAVLGIGRFGASLARTLYSLGHEVLAVDNDEDVIQDIADDVTHAVIADCVDENALRSLGLRNFDVAVVAIGGNLQSSILATLVLKDLGVAYVVAKAQSDLHAKVLERVGADKVVFPEYDMGVRLANSLSSENILDYIELSSDYSIAEIVVPDGWVGMSLKDINVRAKHGIIVLACKNENGVHVAPGSDYVLKKEDDLVVLGPNDKLTSLQTQ